MKVLIAKANVIRAQGRSLSLPPFLPPFLPPSLPRDLLTFQRLSVGSLDIRSIHIGFYKVRADGWVGRGVLNRDTERGREEGREGGREGGRDGWVRRTKFT